MTRYVYYVSYSHEQGFGCCQIFADGGPITTMENILRIRSWIADNSDGKLRTEEVLLLNWILLRTVEI